MSIRDRIVYLVDTLRVALKLMGPLAVIFAGCAVLTVLSIVALLAEVL